MFKKRILVFATLLGVTGTLFFVFGASKTPVIDDDTSKLTYQSDGDVDENINIAESDDLPIRLNPEFPEKIDNPHNPCYSLEVSEEIKENKLNFSENINKTDVLNRSILEKSELPLEIFRGNENIRSVALTIDTGVGGIEGVGQLLDLAEHYNIDLTFFVTGCWVLENPELTQEILIKGHSLGNHSLSHLNLSKASVASIEREIGETSRIIEEVAGFQPIFFRKPQYAGGDIIVKMAGDYGMISIQGYPDLGDTGGWHSDSSPEGVFRRVKNGTSPGAIWVFHNLSLSDLKAFEDIIRFHLEEGYKLVKIEEII